MGKEVCKVSILNVTHLSHPGPHFILLCSVPCEADSYGLCQWIPLGSGFCLYFTNGRMLWVKLCPSPPNLYVGYFSPSTSVQFSSVTQSCPTLCDSMNHSTPGLPIHHQFLKLMSIKSVMPSSHLILCCPLLLLPPIPPSIRVFSNE